MQEVLDGIRADTDLVPLPQRPELRAPGEQQVGVVRGPGVGAAERDDLAEPRGEHPGQAGVIVRRVPLPGGRVGEPAEADAAGRAGVAGGVAGQGDTERALPQRLAEFGDDLRGGVVEPVQDA